MNSIAFDRRAHPAGATFSTWSAEDGWPIRRMDWVQAPGQPVRGSLLFAGGRGDFIEKYLEALAHWHGRGWNVTTFDWRGQGASRGAGRAPMQNSLDPLVADAAAFIGSWMLTAPPPHFAIAHSMGGHLLLRVLAEHRPPLAGAVLIAPMIGINSAPLPAWLAAPLARLLRRLGGGERDVWKDNARPSQPGSRRQGYLTSCRERYSDELWWRAQQPDFRFGAPSWAWLDAAYRSIASLSVDRLKRVDVPVLLIGAARDRLVSVGEIKRVAAILPDAELLMFEKAGHEILREADPVRMAALDRIDEFLAGHSPA